MSLIKEKTAAATNEHMETVAALTIEQQLQLVAVKSGGSLESQLTAAALATVVARMVKLDDADQRALFECVKDLSTIKNREDAEDTMKTILEILEPRPEKTQLACVEQLEERHSRQTHESWLIWVSQRIKDLREVAGLTQSELAERSGLPQSHISRLEAGRHSPSMKTLTKIATALNVDVGRLNLLEN